MEYSDKKEDNEKICMENCLTEIAFIERIEDNEREDVFKNIMRRLNRELKELVLEKDIKSLTQLKVEVKKTLEKPLNIENIILTAIRQRTRFENIDEFIKNKISELKKAKISEPTIIKILACTIWPGNDTIRIKLSEVTNLTDFEFFVNQEKSKLAKKRLLKKKEN